MTLHGLHGVLAFIAVVGWGTSIDRGYLHSMASRVEMGFGFGVELGSEVGLNESKSRVD